MRAALEPLRVASFRRVAAAYSAGQVADWLVEVALALAVFDRTGSALASAFVFVALRVVPVLALPLVAKRSLAALSALRACAVLALAIGVGALPVWALLVLGIADGAGSLAGRAGSRAETARLLEGAGAGAVRSGNALLNVAFAAAAASAPVAAGGLVGGPGAAIALALAAGLLALAAALVRAVGARRPARRARVSLQSVLAQTGCGGLLAVEALLLILFTAAVPVELPYVKDSLGAGDGGYGALLAAWGAGMVGGSLAFAALGRVRLPALAGAATLAVAAAYALMGAAPALPVALLAAAIGGAGNGIQWVAVVSWTQRRGRAAAGTELAALLESLAALAPGAGFLLGGVTVTLLDPRACLFAGAAAIALVAAASAGGALLRAPPGFVRRPAANPVRAANDVAPR